jgi:REP element-mobilizing transposase RayT
MPDPLGFFLTWTTYGTWLPGDERGWVERGNGFQLPDPVRKLDAEARMKEDACRLDDEQRLVVEKTITDHCRIRGWELHAVNCRSNHVHVVVSANRDPDTVCEQFKAWCTRRLKELELARRVVSGVAEATCPIRENWWTEKGSRRLLWDEENLEAAIQYVRDRQ